MLVYSIHDRIQSVDGESNAWSNEVDPQRD
jgi:hypothetical protein